MSKNAAATAATVEEEAALEAATAEAEAATAEAMTVEAAVDTVPETNPRNPTIFIHFLTSIF